LPIYIHITDSAEVFFYKIYLMEQMQLQGITKNISFFRNRVILIIKNDTVADINVRILTRLASETRVYCGGARWIINGLDLFRRLEEGLAASLYLVDGP
jgi:hypothetical protein